jgi:hypothetical protein
MKTQEVVPLTRDTSRDSVLSEQLTALLAEMHLAHRTRVEERYVRSEVDDQLMRLRDTVAELVAGIRGALAEGRTVVLHSPRGAGHHHVIGTAGAVMGEVVLKYSPKLGVEDCQYHCILTGCTRVEVHSRT